MRIGNAPLLLTLLTLLATVRVGAAVAGAAADRGGPPLLRAASAAAGARDDAAKGSPEDELDLLAVLKEDPDAAAADPEALARHGEADARRRRLASDGEFHSPLPENAGLETAACASASTFLPDPVPPGSPFVIPRGECWKIDSDAVWDLPDGLLVEGKLYVPSGSRFELRTAFVFVVGILKIDPPDEGKGVRFRLTGEEPVVYISDAGNLCEDGCDVGSKGIVVLGGQLDIRGLDPDTACPSWEKLADKIQDGDGAFSSLRVSAAAASCWNKTGTELLLTSHTRTDADKQFVTVTGYDPSTGSLTVDPPVDPATLTTAQDPTGTYAVEVASLSRPVAFEADVDADDTKVGGHLMVHRTSAKQIIEGVEIRGFGQLGRLGRYPVHFHMSGDHPDSVVSKNVVRDSNQRGYVVHLTNNVTVEDNIGVDIVGHCYFLEDGDETGNSFRRNLAAGIVVMPRSISDALGAKNDNGAAAFWISNAGNSFERNVAAGGENGYWFDTRGDLKRTNLVSFEGNEAHSIRVAGLRTYNPGWRPFVANTLKDFRAYRNFGMGAFVHVSQNMRFEGGLFADNGEQAVFLSRSDNTEFIGTTFVGQSEVNPPHCRDFWDKVGISLHSGKFNEWTTDGSFRGTTLTNVEFANWSANETGCAQGRSRPLEFNTDDIFVPHFDAPHAFADVKMDASLFVDACPPSEGYDVTDFAVEVVSDAHGSFGAEGPGFLVSPEVEAMLPPSSCGPYGGCLSWCPGACLRTVTVRTGDAPMPEDVQMIVTDDDDVGGKSITIDRGQRAFDEIHRHDAFFGAALPTGSFTAKFVRKSDGERVWPGFAVPVFEHAPTCGPYIEPVDLAFDVPSADRGACDSLVHNGDFESGLDGWAQNSDVGLHIVEGAGVNGSSAGATDNWSDGGAWPFQFLDTSCLDVGDHFEIAVSYSLVDFECASDCPRVGIAHQDWDPSAGTYGTQVEETIDTTADYIESAGFVRATGYWTVTADQASAAKVLFYIETGPYDLLVDDVRVVRAASLPPTPTPTPVPTPPVTEAGYVLRTDIQGPSCPPGLEVPEEECEAASVAVKPAGMNLRKGIAVVDKSWTPCGCFYWEGGSQNRVYYDMGVQCYPNHGRVVGMVCRSG